jgi:hypothetical protein
MYNANSTLTIALPDSIVLFGVAGDSAVFPTEDSAFN